jgi:hypothetical protein
MNVSLLRNHVLFHCCVKNIAPLDPAQSQMSTLHHHTLFQTILMVSSTEHRGRLVNTHALYSGGPGFTSRPGGRLS